MIHHLSVAAHDPQAVADFFADMMDGFAIPFPPNPGSFMAFARDGRGTAVEIYPAGSVLRPAGIEGAEFARREIDLESPTHFALSVAFSSERIRQEAAARGWACFECSRGGDFRVMEVWVENTWLVELLPPAFAQEYLSFVNRFVDGADIDALMSTHTPKPSPARVLELA